MKPGASAAKKDKKKRLGHEHLAVLLLKNLIQIGNPRFPLQGSFEGDIDIDIRLSGLLLRNLT